MSEHMAEHASILYVKGETPLATDLLATALRAYYPVMTAPNLASRSPKVEIGVAFARGLQEVTVLVQGIRRLFPQARMIVVGGTFADERRLSLIEIGVRAFVPEDASVAVLLKTIDEVSRGHASCPDRLASLVFDRLAMLERPEPRDIPVALSTREAEIFGLVREGQSNKEIAAKLSISVSTVKNHVHKILEKLQLRRRSEALDWNARVTCPLDSPTEPGLKSSRVLS